MIDDLISVLSFLREWLVGHAASREAHSEKLRKAIHSLATAVTLTRRYLYERSRGDARSDEHERRIAAAWLDASDNLTAFDPNLAAQAFVKADYWADPRIWDHQHNQGIAVDLETMADACRRLQSRDQ